MAAIVSRDLGAGVDGRDQPAAVFLGAEEIGETGGRIKARPAEPIDRTVAPNEGGRLAIADDGIVLDVLSHGPPYPREPQDGASAPQQEGLGW